MDKKFVVFTINRNNIRKFFFDDILYFKASGAYTIIKLENEEIIISKYLKEVNNYLNTNKFVRINRSYIVNLDKCIEILKGKSPYIIMKNNKKMKVGLKYIDNLIEKFYY